jgi:3-oxoacyl-[acyl-carrier protein] reductase
MNTTSTKSFSNLVCVVTGGTRGIGRAIAAMLSQEGAAVTICGRAQESVDDAVAGLIAATGGKVNGKVADVSNGEQVGNLLRFVDAEYGGIDVLINNAGVGMMRPISELSVSDWHKTIDTNLTGVFYCCREALQRFKVRGGGYIVNISSLAGKSPFAGGAAYNASKFGLTGFSEAIMLDERNENVRVSYIMPGSVATEFGGQAAESGSDWKIWPEDIAGIVRTLLLMPKRTLISRVEVRPSKPKR